MKINKNLLAAALVFLTFLIPKSVLASKNHLKIYFFYSPGCPHCSAENEEVLCPIEDKGDVEVVRFDISKEEGRKVAQVLSEEYGLNFSGTPRTIIGETFIKGYLNYETHGVQIEKSADSCLQSGCKDIVAAIFKDVGQFKEADPAEPTAMFEHMKLPLLGAINPKAVSLPVLTLIIALLDGFNPCAMWTLVFLISLLLGLKSRKRRYILGSAFIAVSTLVYFLFLTAWLNVFLFLGFVRWLQVGIGFFALGAAIWSIRDFFVNKEGGCSVEGSKEKQKVFERLKQVVRRDNLWFSLIGIAGLAFVVNLVELLCSAGLPAIYTQVLSLSNLPIWEYYAYLIFYVLIFMADDLVVFIVAMKTMELFGVESKYARYSRLLGGIIMFVIGAFLIFKPEVLMIG